MNTKTPLTASREIDFDAVAREIEAGYITSRKHPIADLYILNYTPKCQFAWRWNTETMNCRGLIVDGTSRVVARPFQKFFTYEQLDGNVPSEPFEVYEKLDGSLGILYFLDGKPYIATRGSFESEMAQKANGMLHRNYSHWIPYLQPHLTYLFEIIYAANRIVVDYGETEELFLLAAIETEMGTEIPIESIVWQPRATRFDGLKDFNAVLSMQNEKDEGFVVRFESGIRVKVKMEEYKRLHRILTGMSSRRLYEYMGIAAMRGVYTTKQIGRTLHMDASEVEKVATVEDPLAQVLDRIPDEFYKWVQTIQIEIESRYAAIEDRAIELFRRRPEGSRREQAEYFARAGSIPSVLFNILDGKVYAHDIWRAIRPEHARPFREDEG